MTELTFSDSSLDLDVPLFNSIIIPWSSSKFLFSWIIAFYGLITASGSNFSGSFSFFAFLLAEALACIYF